jgi:hypothetical protein
VEHAHDRVRDRRFAAARLAGQAEDFAGRDLEGDAIDGPHRPARRQVLDIEFAHIQQRFTERRA